MTNHKFITNDTEEVFTGSEFITSTSKTCLTCGGLWMASQVNYEFTQKNELPPVLSPRGEQPTTCLPESDRRHSETASSHPTWEQQLLYPCNCWLCDS